MGAVRIGFSGVTVLQGVLTADLHRVHRAHPRVELNLVELAPAAQLQGVREGALDDIGYSLDLGLDHTGDLVVTCRARTTLSIAMRPDHELATGASVTVADLVDRNLIVFASREDDETVLTRLGPGLHAHRSRVHLVSGTLGVLALASAGVGVAIVPTATERITLPDITYRPCATAPRGRTW
ncbi:LysR family substrate-binding domain-containing protein [Fodinicola feengrottensis]|uniref:LysR family substrate-binding domain-containing protein n=1 Tax=Fodinicola feengrottensis TaxID=435914 RepID=UPI0036F3D68E